MFCVAGADWSLAEINERSRAEEPKNLAKTKMGELRHRLSHTKVEEVLAGGMHQFIDLLQNSLNDIGDAMNEDYFHSLVSEPR